jgi:DNA-binding MarR family transcriptional regulator
MEANAMKIRQMKDTLSPGDYEALADLRYQLRKFTEFSTSVAQKAGVPPQQHQALLAIKGLAPGREMTVGMLADRLLIAPHTATELVDRLVEAGYVERSARAFDHRRRTMKLSAKADGLLDDLTAAHLHEIREMAPELMLALRILQDRRKMEQAAWMQ